MFNKEQVDLILQGIAGAEFIRDNKDKEEIEIESTDNEKLEVMNTNKISKKRRIQKKQKHCLHLA